MRPEEEHLNTAPPKKKGRSGKETESFPEKEAPFPAVIRQIF